MISDDADLLPTKPLPRSFYNRETISVAQELLGTTLVHVVNGTVRIGRVVETEAYLGAHDKACHSARGRTPRTAPMFGPPGHAYVYLIYGMYHCMNVVTEPPGCAAAVLIRAVEPIAGLEGRADGPGRLCRAMAIDRTCSGQDLKSPTLYLSGRPRGSAPRILRRPRVGVAYAGAWARRLLRFSIKGNSFVSPA